MKRIWALLCAVWLLAGCALAEDPAQTDIAALMARQVSSNCVLRGQLTAELSEKAPFFASGEGWETLRAWAADTALETTYIFSRAGQTLGNSQASLYLKRGEETLSTLRLSGRGEEWEIFGDPTGDQVWILPRQTELLLRDKYLTLPGWGQALLRGMGALEASLNAPEEGQWPALYRFLTAAATQDDEWRHAFEICLKPYTEQVSAWLQERSRVYLVRGGDALTTGSEVRLDGDALAEEALTLLNMFYNDRVMLSLLRPLMTKLEAEAYLEPGMQILFESVLRNMRLPGEFVLDRRYDAEGELDRLEAAFPLPGGIILHWSQAGSVSILRLETPGFAAEISLTGSLENGLSGAFSLKTDRTYSGKYQWTASMQPVYEDEDENGRSRRQNGDMSLIIQPDAGQDFPAMTLTAALTARSGLQTDQSAHWNLELDWQELGGGAYAHIALKTRTGAPIQQVEAAGQRVDLTVLSPAERRTLLEEAAENLNGVH